MTFGSNADETESKSILDAATDAGVNFVDTANRYPSDASDERKGYTEQIIGMWLKGRRERFIVSSKAGGPMGPQPWDSGERLAGAWVLAQPGATCAVAGRAVRPCCRSRCALRTRRWTTRCYKSWTS